MQQQPPTLSDLRSSYLVLFLTVLDGKQFHFTCQDVLGTTEMPLEQEIKPTYQLREFFPTLSPPLNLHLRGNKHITLLSFFFFSSKFPFFFRS